MDIEAEVIESNGNNLNKERALEILVNKKAFAFEGGGVLGIAYAGALTRLHELGGLKTKTHIVGSSVGSIVATGLACGGTPEYIKDRMFKLDVTRFQDGGNIIRKIFRFISKYGWHKGDAIEDFMGETLKELTGKSDITFDEVYQRYQIHLTIPYLSMRHKKTKYADHIKTPDGLPKQASKWSSSMPYFYKPSLHFTKTQHGHELIDMIIDGGVMDNYPIHVLKEQGCKPIDIIGFKFCGPEEFNRYEAIKNNEEDLDIDYGIPRNIKDYSITLVEMLRHQALRYHVHNEDWKLTCKINIGNFSSIDFDISEEDKEWLYNEGKKAVDNYLLEIEEMLNEGTYF